MLLGLRVPFSFRRATGCALTGSWVFCNVRDMRYLFIVTVVAGWGLGCATVPPAVPPQIPALVREAETWRLQYEEERARSEELAQRLAAAESTLEELQLERMEAEQARQALIEELARLEAERHVLEEHNAQLQVRQRELAEIHEQMADVWFESALSRARRHSPPQEPPAPAPQGEPHATP
jgi:septal ring factor EnvC (AmiA/AmiB activator)